MCVLELENTCTCSCNKNFSDGSPGSVDYKVYLKCTIVCVYLFLRIQEIR